MLWPPNRWSYTPLGSPDGRNSSPYYPLLLAHGFWFVVVCKFIKWWPPKATMYFFIIVSIIQIVATNDGTTPSHTL